jgi:CDP-6-deoxy-D-xylo-4-hexulose-3-dehydrase
MGYNLKITDMQAACGLAQLDRLEGFIEQRKANFDFLLKNLTSLEEFLILPVPTPYAEPSWFGFPVTLRSTSPVGRLELLTYLEQEKVGTRLLFAGNLVRQPYMAGKNYRVSNELTHTDRVMNDTFWIGLQPALTQDMLTYSASTIANYLGVEI